MLRISELLAADVMRSLAEGIGRQHMVDGFTAPTSTGRPRLVELDLAKAARAPPEPSCLPASAIDDRGKPTRRAPRMPPR